MIRVFSASGLTSNLYSNTSLFFLFSTQALLFQSSGTVFMVGQDYFLAVCLEGFLYGKVSESVLFFTLAKQVELFSCLGLYSGILAMYLQCQSNNSTGRTATIVFYAICLLYVLSTVNFVSDLAIFIFEVSNNSICSKNIIFYQLCSRVSVHRFFPLKMCKPQ